MVGGRNATAGRLEFCYGGVWGTVCRDRWGTPDAGVACRQLGFPSQGNAMNQWLKRSTILNRILRMIQFNVRNSVPGIFMNPIIRKVYCIAGNIGEFGGWAQNRYCNYWRIKIWRFGTGLPYVYM